MNSDVQTALNRGDTDHALRLACFNGHVDVVSQLLQQRDIDINQKNWSGNTALSLACRMGHVDVVSRLLKHRDIDINKTNQFDDTALSLVCRRGHVDVDDFLDSRHEVIFNMLMDRPDLVIYDFALGDAVDFGLVEPVRRLISCGADVDFDRQYLTDVLAENGRFRPGEHSTAITAMLLEAGFRPSGGVADVREKFFLAPSIQPQMMTAVSKPLTLKQGCRKTIWRVLRNSTGGRNITPVIDELKHQLPGPLIKYLKFKD